VPFVDVAAALHGFTGVQRRFTVRADVGGVLIVDDYGHHPVEIEATLRGAAKGFPDRRMVAVFQPHRYTRLESLWADFCAAFNDADTILVCPVYAAGEVPIEGVDHHRFVSDVRERGHRGAGVVDSLEEAADWLAQEVREGDVVITLGAGSVHLVCGLLAERLEARS
jgi:UDP-N-acetylmuramate--alanine ligase